MATARLAACWPTMCLSSSCTISEGVMNDMVALATLIGRDAQSGMVTVLFENVIWSPAAGAALMGGTFARVIAGAAPGVPPRGTVRTTCDGGSAVLLFNRAYI